MTEGSGAMSGLAVVAVVAVVALAPGCGPGAPTPTPTAGQAKADPVASTPTFANGVAALVHAKCATCHHDGGPGPFALVEYSELRDHGEQMLEVTHAGYMPPWLAEPGPAAFVLEDQRRLSVAEQQLLDDWVAAGMPAGDLASAPPPPRFETGWRLGPPDLVLSADAAFELPADGLDIYRNFVIPVPEELGGLGPRFVKALELLPGPEQVVHHAVVRVDVTGEAARLDAADEAPGFDGMVFGGARMPGGRFLGWTPGKSPDPGDDSRAWQLAGGSALVVQVHLRPSGKPESIRPQIGLHFSAGDRPPSRQGLAMVLSSSAIDIAPGAADFRVHDSLTLPADVELRSIYPHAHYIGKHLRGYAVLPGGARRELIEIRDWDFNWQDEYRFVEPVALPAGTEIHMDFAYDNSAANPRNPASPPVRVRYGASSTDEMAELIFEVEPRDPAQLTTLDQAFMAKWLDGQIIAIEASLAAGTADPGAQRSLAALLARAGRLDQAQARYEAALVAEDGPDTRVEYALLLRERGDLAGFTAQIDQALALAPEHARAHLVRGNAQRTAGELEPARASYLRALGADPDLVEAHNNLGVTLEKLGRPAEAAASFARAVELAPGRALFHKNHGRALEAAGQYDEALGAYRSALQRDARSLESLRGAAWLLATHPDPARRDPNQALRIAELAAQATDRRSPEILEALAAAHAAAGRFELAQQVLAAALELARAGSRPELVARYEAHARSFAAHQALILPLRGH